jgi:hypothetical protein
MGRARGFRLSFGSVSVLPPGASHTFAEPARLDKVALQTTDLHNLSLSIGKEFSVVAVRRNESSIVIHRDIRKIGLR